MKFSPVFLTYRVNKAKSAFSSTLDPTVKLNFDLLTQNMTHTSLSENVLMLKAGEIMSNTFQDSRYWVCNAETDRQMDSQTAWIHNTSGHYVGGGTKIWQQVIKWTKCFVSVTLSISVKAKSVTHITLTQHTDKLLLQNTTCALKPVTNEYLLRDGLIQSVHKTFPSIRFFRINAWQTFLRSTQLPVFPTTAGITTTARATTSSAFKQQCKHLRQTNTQPPHISCQLLTADSLTRFTHSINQSKHMYRAPYAASESTGTSQACGCTTLY